MTFQEMMAEIPHLSHDERLALLDAVHRSLRQESAQSHTDALLRLRGILRPDTPLPDTYGYKEAYAAHVVEKYR
jgi:hypothetical protein